MKISVLGDGGWGTALAILLRNKGFNVSLWGAFKHNIDLLDKNRENKKFLPGIKIPKDILITSEAGIACKDSRLVILAIPSRFLRQVLLANKNVLIGKKLNFVSVVKGIEESTLKRMSEVVIDVLGNVKIAVLSGPSIAPEVARLVPTAVTVSSEDISFAQKVRDIFRAEHFRVYTNKDIIGVELGGSLKNIIAIAAGISDGLGFGANTKAAILTRGLSEITKLGAAMGASAETFKGLSGLGDLITTCISPEGRNHKFGEQIGRGKKPSELLKKSVMEIEGAWTSRAALLLGKKHKIELPITHQVYSVIFEAKSPLAAVSDLMIREPKEE